MKNDINDLKARREMETAYEGENDQWYECQHILPPLDAVVFLCEADGNMFIGQRADNVDGWLWCSVDDPYYYKGQWQTDDAEPDDWHPVWWLPFPTLPKAVSNRINEGRNNGTG